ncbi:recombinase family protein [Brevundimonas bullata]|uniref:recombinase family protein n=3 Tax=Brevundimonas TaxID=41275 RepID=UPI003D9A0E62
MDRTSVHGGGEGEALMRAAQYVRMSTEHQKYSTENQSEAIAAYAARRGFEIVKTYADAGKSGLKLDGRAALQGLIADVRNGVADFDAVIVYDVSRWG